MMHSTSDVVGSSTQLLDFSTLESQMCNQVHYLYAWLQTLMPFFQEMNYLSLTTERLASVC
jgi:hypothetical protein